MTQQPNRIQDLTDHGSDKVVAGKVEWVKVRREGLIFGAVEGAEAMCRRRGAEIFAPIRKGERSRCDRDKPASVIAPANQSGA